MEQQQLEQASNAQQSASAPQPTPAQGRDSENSYISYRQKRRLTQSQRQNVKKTRGQTRGLKWRDERKNRLGVNPTCSIASDMKRIVGENANQFITECANNVRSLLPLNCRGWKDMDSDVKKRLLEKIKAEWNFLEGADVDRALEIQCQAIYRHWHYSLKENHFTGYTIAEAIKNCPKEVNPDQWAWIVRNYWGTEKAKRISEKNRRSRSKQKVPGNQGSKSTARILEMMRKYQAGHSSQSSEQVTETSEEGTQPSQGTVVGSNEVQPPPEPEYITLWILTKRRKDNTWDKVAEEKLEQFKELHKQQVELYGVDKLTVQEAYLKVLGTSSGYINGLGFGPKAPKSISEGKSSGDGIEIVHQMSLQMEQMDKQSREREAVLKAQVEKGSMEIERLKEDKAEMLEEIKKLKQETEEREARMNADFRAMQAQFSAFLAAKPQL